jgi:hypothetical protein
MTVTPDDIAREQRYYKSKVAAHVEAIIANLSLQHEDSPVHNVEAYRDGLRIPVNFSGDRVLYVYCLPWARGWSIFTSPDTQDIYSFSWRHVNVKWASFQQPIYCPRDVLGPWNCPVPQISAAFDYIVRRVASHEKRRRAQLKKGY